MGALNRTFPGADRPAQEKSALEPVMNDKSKIFVVEDDTDISRLVRHHLEMAGYRVRSYSSTHRAGTSRVTTLPAESSQPSH